MSFSNGFKFWFLVAIVFIAFLWIFYAPMLPFIIGLILAYILNPAVNKIECKGVNRLIATNIVLFGFLTLVTLFFWLFVPILSDQMQTFFHNLPQYRQKAAGFMGDFLGTKWQEDLLGHQVDFQQYLATHAKSALGITGNVINRVFVGLVGLVRNLTFILIIPVVAFYFLLDWHILTGKIKDWLPRKHAPLIKSLLKDMDNIQAGFIRGQVIVCMIQAIFYMTALSIIGLDYSITLGFVTGVLTFIPYIGAGLGFIVVLLIACVQFLPSYYPILLVFFAFSIGQILEGYVWVPKIVGNSVSLHPLWIMFSLLAFGSIWGLSGMLIAVPVTAAIGVLMRFALNHYIQSRYYGTDSGN